MRLLRVENLTVAYGECVALHNVSIEISEGETVCVFGPNSAGKTTLLKAIMSQIPTKTGRIAFRGSNISAVPTHKIVGLGMTLLPEGRQLFGSLSVLQNLRLGMYSRRHDRLGCSEDLERMFALFPILRERQAQRADTLSGGQQQMVALARALLSRPKLLLLDEPSQGLAPNVIEQMFEQFRILKGMGQSLLVVEQNVGSALKVADRCYFLQRGRVVFERDAAFVKTDRKVIELYLGGDESPDGES